MTRILGAAVAIGAWTSRHRIIASLAVFAVLAAVVGGSTFGVLARQDPMPANSGTSAPGSHKFYDKNDVDNSFCNACHNAIAGELGASVDHKNWPCSSCHGKSTNGHAATTAMCADCHYGGSAPKFQVAEQLNDPTEAHQSFYQEIGETPPTASWVCKACHTEVSVDLQVTQNPDLPLQLGPTYP